MSYFLLGLSSRFVNERIEVR